MDHYETVSDFLIEETGSPDSTWKGTLSFDEQHRLFGKVFGRGTIIIDGGQEKVMYWARKKGATDHRVIKSYDWSEL